MGKRRALVLPAQLPLVEGERILMWIWVFLASTFNRYVGNVLSKYCVRSRPNVHSKQITIASWNHEVSPPLWHEDRAVRQRFIVLRLEVLLARSAVVHPDGRE